MGMFSVDIAGVAGAALGIIGIVLLTYLVTFGLGIVMYILQALGLYTIAQRRGIKHPWLAWLPLTNMWILGSVADQYRYVSRGQIRNRRKWLLFLNIIMLALSIAAIAGYVAVFVEIAVQIPDLSYVFTGQPLGGGVIPALWVFGVLAAVWVLAVIETVIQYVCLYDLYASCCPSYKVLFLVLSILFNVTVPFLVFGCRNKDGGMPPRKDEAPRTMASDPERFQENTEE